MRYPIVDFTINVSIGVKCEVIYPEPLLSEDETIEIEKTEIIYQLHKDDVLRFEMSTS